MGIKKLKPVTPAQRFRTVSDFSELTTDRPEKSLLEPLTKTGGRNNKGRIIFVLGNLCKQKLHFQVNISDL